MSKAPSMPMYWDAYLADTTHLTTEEHGAYLLLLAAMWRRNGCVPDDDKDNARILGLSASKWRKTKSRFQETISGFVVSDGFIYQEKLASEYTAPEPRPWVPVAVQHEVWDRDGQVCAYCGNEDGPFHLDHIFPWSRGGRHSSDNLTVACAACNWSKGDKTLDEWRVMQ